MGRTLTGQIRTRADSSSGGWVPKLGEVGVLARARHGTYPQHQRRPEMHLPKWLYEALPWTYVVAGLLAVVRADHWLWWASGALLFIAGGFVWSARRRYRRETPQQVQLGMLNLPAKLSWQPAFDVGLDLLDRQHRQLFQICNDLIRAVGSRRSDAAVHGLLDELLFDIRGHFQTEERIAGSLGQALTPEHRQAHAVLMARAEHERQRCLDGHIDMDQLVRYLALDVVAAHVLEDRRHFDHPRARLAIAAMAEP